MPNYQTTEEKLKSAKYANTGLFILLISVGAGFATNAVVGTIVFFCGLFLAHLSEQRKKEKQQALDMRLSLYSMGVKIALRKIYLETADNETRSQVKQFAMESPFIHGWEFLDLELSDCEFQSKCEREGSGELYSTALRKIHSDGSPVLLKGRKIVGMQKAW